MKTTAERDSKNDHTEKEYKRSFNVTIRVSLSKNTAYNRGSETVVRAARGALLVCWGEASYLYFW
jgi:hypothetical protein